MERSTDVLSNEIGGIFVEKHMDLKELDALGDLLASRPPKPKRFELMLIEGRETLFDKLTGRQYPEIVAPGIQRDMIPLEQGE